MIIILMMHFLYITNLEGNILLLKKAQPREGIEPQVLRLTAQEENQLMSYCALPQ